MNIDKNNQKTTPRKAVIDICIGGCRVCNADISTDRHRVFLYGIKSERGGILKCLQEFMSSEDRTLIHEDDGLSKYICRKCESKILSFVKIKEELKSSFLATESANRRSCEGKRFKRGRKDDENVPLVDESPLPFHIRKKPVKPHSRTATRITLAPRFDIPLHPARASLASRYSSENGNSTIIQKGTNTLPQLTSNVTAVNETIPNVPIQPRMLPDFLKSKQHCEVSSIEKGLDILKEAGIHDKADDTRLTLSEQNSICREVMSSTPKELATIMMNIPELERHVKGIILSKINGECKMLCSKGHPSILRTPRAKHKELAKVFNWKSILKEMKERAPFVLDILATIAVPKIKLDGSQIPPICTAYAVLMNTRNRELSIIQKMNAVILGAGNATQKTFKRLSKLGLTQSRDNLRNLMDDIGCDSESNIKQLIVKEKKDLRIVSDNIDFKILVNITLRNHQNSDIHWMAQYCTFDRVSSSHLDDTKPQIENINSFENKEYLLSKDELRKLKSDFTVIVSRILVDFFPCLQYLQQNVCSHIEHRYSKEMATKSTVISLPIMPFNQTKHSEVVQYLENIEDFLIKIHSSDDPIPQKKDDACAGETISPEQKDEILNNVKSPLMW